MNTLITLLLQPVTAAQPCGPDLSTDAQFDALEKLLKGKPEVELGTIKTPAEPPDWRALQDQSAEYLRQSKHLRVALMLTCSLLQTEGLEGFRDGLQLIRGLLEQFWDSVYPLLDPADNNDPTQRLSILGGLNMPRGSWASGWLAIHEYLYTTPLCHPKGSTPITYEELQAAKPAGGSPLAAALRACAEQVDLRCQTLQEALAAVQGIDQFLTKILPAGKSINFEELTNLLQGMLSALKPYLPGYGVQPGLATAEPAAGQSPGGASLNGGVHSRTEVVRALDSLCRYYEEVEPGSPVPYLLRRAQKLATMNFVESVQELNLATMESLRPSMGSALPSTSPAGKAPSNE